MDKAVFIHFELFFVSNVSLTCSLVFGIISQELWRITQDGNIGDEYACSDEVRRQFGS